MWQRPKRAISQLGNLDWLRTINRRGFTKSCALPKRKLPRVNHTKESILLQPRQKPVLEDNHGRYHHYLRISLTERCNLRCTYCMPEEGADLSPNEELLTTSEIIQLATHFVQNGVTKIRLTGGEPLINPNVVEICSALNELKPLGLSTIAITTNGILLSRKLKALKDNGLTHVNLSLDTLDPWKYEQITRRNGLKKVFRAISDCLDEGYEPSINVVVMRKFNDMELVEFVELTRTRPVHVRFIEFMPFDGNSWKEEKMVPYYEMEDVIRAAHPSLTRLDYSASETAKEYRIDNHKGTVGFISSMSNHFCSTCSRIRITADGNLKVCLFGQSEVSLRDAIRSGCSEEQLTELIHQSLGRKKARHAGMHNIASNKNRPMVKIGG